MGTQRIPDRESIPKEHTKELLGVEFKKTHFFFNSTLLVLHLFELSAHLEAGGEYFQSQERLKKRHFLARENCQNYLSEICLPHLGY